jgi:Dolichyl-phosphate-mannose-protein mannosyltransferase
LYGSYALLRPPLPDGQGTIHAEIAREMVTRHDWLTPYANGVAVKSSSRALDWSIGASYKLFGIADWSARLPIALCVLALAVLVFFFGRRLFVWNAAGLYAALLVLVWPGTFVATRPLTSVPLLCVETTIVAFFLWHLLAVKKLAGPAGVAITATACALMLLTGNWPAMVVPLVVAIACWFARRSLQPTRLVEWPLLAWAAAAYLFGDLLEARPHNPLTWIGPVPPIALLLGGWLANREAFSNQTRTRRLAYTIFAAGLVLSAVLIFFAIEEPLGFSFFAYSVVLTSGLGQIPFIILAAAVIAGVTGNLVYRLHKNARAANCFLAGMLAGVTVALQAGFVLASPAYSSQILADAIRPELAPTDIVVVDGKYPEASSFAFYLERPISFAIAQGTTAAGGIQVAIGAVAVDQVWNNPTRVYLWTRSDHPFQVPGQSYVVAASGGKEVLSNQPNSGGASF